MGDMSSTDAEQVVLGGFAHLKTVHLGAEVAAGLIGFAFLLSPIPTIWKIFKKRDTEKHSSLPYILLAYNSTLWAMYAYFSANTFQGLAFSVGAFIQWFYVVVFGMFVNKEMKKRFYIYISVVVTSFLVLGAIASIPFISVKTSNYVPFGYHPTEQQLEKLTTDEAKSKKIQECANKLAANIVGTVASIVNVGLYASPLATVKNVLQTKDLTYMPISFIALGLASSFAWGVHSVTYPDKIDYFMGIVCLIGLILNIAQFVLYLVILGQQPKNESAAEPLNPNKKSKNSRTKKTPSKPKEEV